MIFRLPRHRDNEALADDWLAEIEQRYNAARTLRPIQGANQMRLEAPPPEAGHPTWVLHGVGTANHWRWLAMLILGLDQGHQVPNTEERPTPEVVPFLIAEIRRQRAKMADMIAPFTMHIVDDPRAVIHAIGYQFCDGCEWGYPKRCDCGGFVHASADESGYINLLACDECGKADESPQENRWENYDEDGGSDD